MGLNHRSDEPSVVPSPLPQSVGYGVVVAAGLAFAFGDYPADAESELKKANYGNRHDGLDGDSQKNVERR